MFILICMYLCYIQGNPGGNWPLHDILSRLGFCARTNPPVFCPFPTCIAHTIEILLQYCCARNDPLRMLVCMPYTIQYWYWQYRVKANAKYAIRTPVAASQEYVST